MQEETVLLKFRMVAGKGPPFLSKLANDTLPVWEQIGVLWEDWYSPLDVMLDNENNLYAYAHCSLPGNLGRYEKLSHETILATGFFNDSI